MYNKNLIKTCFGQQTDRIPVWFMRQAGRYLPEYLEERKNFDSFIDFCLTPKSAAKVTIQPLKRFDLDAAIIFADILLILTALSINVRFEKGKGPLVDNSDIEGNIKYITSSKDVFAKVAESVNLVRKDLDLHYPHVSLIGFAGSPWTVMCYLLEGQGSKNFMKARSMLYTSKAMVDKIKDIITEATIEYLSGQIEAGAEGVKLFDSWAGILEEESFKSYVIEPTKRIVSELKRKYPNVPIIGFCRGAGPLYLNYIAETGIDVAAVDQFLPLDWIKNNLQSKCTVQGNLDNILLASNVDMAVERTREILNALAPNKPFIFNLGHGIIPDTKIENVSAVVDAVRDFEHAGKGAIQRVTE